jgi:hypothetical protein
VRTKKEAELSKTLTGCRVEYRRLLIRMGDLKEQRDAERVASVERDNELAQAKRDLESVGRGAARANARAEELAALVISMAKVLHGGR